MSTRRSARSATTKSAPLPESNANDISDDEFVAEDDGDAPPDEKKARGKKRKVSAKSKQGGQSVPKKTRGIRGMLKDMIEMPMDVLYEIFSQLDPIDLVHLSRTSKDLREMLMSRTSISIWKAARANITPAMPECPDDMSEAEYAELAFGKSCQYCSRKIGTLNRAWEARRRICNKCIPEHCSLVYLNSDPPDSLRALFEGKYIDLRSTLPQVHVENTKRRRYRRDECYHFVEYYKIWEEKLPQLNTGQERIKWLQTKQTASKKHARLCSSWFTNFMNHQKEAITELTKTRKALIAKRVKELGWSDEVDQMPGKELPFEEHTDIIKLCHKEITERTWSNLESQINDYMEGVKERRLARERKALLKVRLPILKQVYTDCISSIPVAERESIITAGELFLEPPIQDIVVNLPQDKTLTEEDLLPTMTAVFPDANQRLRLRIEDQLLPHIHASRKELGDESVVDRNTVFSLATTVFQCSKCYPPRSLWYEDIVSHSCTKAMPFPRGSQDGEAISEYLKEGYRTYETNIKVDVVAVKVITELIKLCELDPSTTTKQMMDELNPIFECVKCDNYDGRLTMTWAAVVKHQQFEYSHRDTEVDQYKPELLKGEEAVVARTRIDELQSRKWGQNTPCVVVCAHCGQRKDIKDGLVEHVKQEHGLVKVRAKDFIPDPRRDQVAPFFRMWPPRSEVEDDAGMAIVTVAE